MQSSSISQGRSSIVATCSIAGDHARRSTHTTGPGTCMRARVSKDGLPHYWVDFLYSQKYSQPQGAPSSKRVAERTVSEKFSISNGASSHNGPHLTHVPISLVTLPRRKQKDPDHANRIRFFFIRSLVERRNRLHYGAYSPYVRKFGTDRRRSMRESEPPKTEGVKTSILIQ